MDKYLHLYNFIKGERKKERFDIILEPLQAVTQLALISFCPKGSKLTISNNLLSIQEPTWFQGLLRSNTLKYVTIKANNLNLQNKDITSCYVALSWP